MKYDEKKWNGDYYGGIGCICEREVDGSLGDRAGCGSRGGGGRVVLFLCGDAWPAKQ